MNASSASGLWPIFTVRMGIRPLVGGEPPTELAGADRADDGVAVAPGVDLDPRLAEVDGAVGVVGRDLHEGDRGRLVEWIAPAGLRHLDRVEGDAAGADSPDALHGLLDREMVASRMVQDVERLAIADDLADVLIEPGPVQLDAVEQDQLRRRAGEARMVLLPAGAGGVGGGDRPRLVEGAGGDNFPLGLDRGGWRGLP